MSLQDVQKRIEDCCAKSRRSPSDIRLLAVSKGQPASAIAEVHENGQREFAENYVEELIQKKESLAHLTDIRWIFIGQLQSNKIQKLIPHCDEIQTIASEKHARYCERYAKDCGKTSFPVWIHVNADHEDQKFGISHEQTGPLARFVGDQCPNLSLQGIMVIPSVSYANAPDDSTPPHHYLKLVQLARGIGLGKISLGMSSDLCRAVAAGTDCVRIGTALFGPRK